MKAQIGTLLLAGLALCLPAASLAAAPRCKSEATCIKVLISEARKDRPPGPQDWVGTTSRAIEIHGALEALGPAVVPALGRLLSHSDRRVRESAAQALARFKASARSELEAAVAALEARTVMAAGLIKAIGDESALPALTRRLTAARSDQEANEIANAIVGINEGGASAPGPRRAFRQVLGDAATVSEARLWAAYYLREVDDQGWRRELASDTPALLVALGDGEERTRSMVMSLLLRLGRLPAPVEDRLRELLARGDWTERPVAAAALGTSGCAAAVPALSAALVARNWRLNLAAAQALRRIGVAARPALGALGEAGRTHWLPRVRQEALRAADAASGKAVSSPEDEATAFLHLESASGGERDPCSGGSDWELDLDGRPVPLAAPERAPGRVGRTVPAAIADRLRSGDQTVLEVDGGWLLANPRGEFGGDLLFVPPRGPPVTLVDRRSIPFIGRIDRRIVALLGTSHSGTGTVLSLERDGAGRWHAEPFVELPATACGLVPAPDGSIIIPTLDGIVSLRPDGGMRKLSCHDRNDDVRAVVQAALDDPGLRRRVRAVRGDGPLRVIAAELGPARPELRFEGKPVTYEGFGPEHESALRLASIHFSPGPLAVLTVYFSPAKIHFERMAFRRGPDGWRRVPPPRR